MNFLTLYIFCRSNLDESVGGIKKKFYNLEHLKKHFESLEIIENPMLTRPISLTSIAPSKMTYMIQKWF